MAVWMDDLWGLTCVYVSTCLCPSSPFLQGTIQSSLPNECAICLDKWLAVSTECDGNYPSLTLDRSPLPHQSPPQTPAPRKTKIANAILLGVAESQSPCLRWHICVQHNTRHPPSPSLGPGMRHLVRRTESGYLKQRKVVIYFLSWVRADFMLK